MWVHYAYIVITTPFSFNLHQKAQMSAEDFRTKFRIISYKAETSAANEESFIYHPSQLEYAVLGIGNDMKERSSLRSQN